MTDIPRLLDRMRLECRTPVERPLLDIIAELHQRLEALERLMEDLIRLDRPAPQTPAERQRRYRERKREKAR